MPDQPASISSSAREDRPPRPDRVTAGEGAAPMLRPSPWTTKEKAWRLAWYAVEGTVFRWSPRTAWGWRRMLLRLFGARIGENTKVHNTTRIEIPWHLTMGSHCATGEHSILYCLGPVTIGHDVSISQYAHVCAGTHEVDSRKLTLLKPPIVIEDYVWVAADAFVGPGIRIGQGAVLGARASAFKDLQPWTIYGGNPARPIRARDKADWLAVLGAGGEEGS